MSFLIHALAYDQFKPYFSYTADALRAIGAQLKTVEISPGSPCRVSLADAEVGETALLINYQHQSAPTPFQSSYAIFVRENAQQSEPDVDEVPHAFTTRVMSIRGYDKAHSLIDAVLTDRGDSQIDRVDRGIESLFENSSIDYAHLHYAAPGCFAATVTRV